ncbi:HAMP domain-containing sensor histidine kinase [Crocosphaera sp. XPORK-15E]|uniref:sensor histidine kinase n=1 Tax=Crocosphaera sp. XPORK-15E TaxID=3110247 RepID=UPI002B20FB14|nr:HAMP domain-containing sensor histidine kinase [Crocosphaera sp. XPORK-15E]MEA5536002.1 HAMP domain-containing sensor histidine kinase [Crocosphaera sp. XPORK-15E]
MSKTISFIRKVFSSYTHQSSYSYGLIISIVTVVIVMEYATPSAYVFGYLYTGAILLANTHINRNFVILVTVTTATLTLLNLFIPVLEIHNLSTIANRIIAMVALLVTGWLSVQNHNYEEKIANQQAQIKAQEQLFQMREDFVSTLTHDLKTPLLGAIETLKSFQLGSFGQVSPKQQKILEMISRSHQSTLQLVETVLDIYRNDNEGLKIDPKPVNLRPLLNEIIASLTDLAQSRRIHINIIGDRLWVKGDAWQLKRVFINLLSNAINHSPRGSNVEILLESKGDEQQILVIDNGLGITKEELPQLFERFYQGVSDRQAKGSGLGLYLSRQIVEAHGGKIWAEVRYPQGAIFGCRLPAIMDDCYDNF